jgi:adhesin/invasin
MNALIKYCTVWSLVTLQCVFPITSFAAPAAHTPSSSTDTPDTLAWSGQMTAVAQEMSSSNGSAFKTTATNMATGATATTVQEWLDHFGTARIQLNVDENGDWGDSSLDYLLPLYDNKKSVLFTQLGIRAPDGRVTSNIGVGVRTYYVNHWMFGGNVFFDHDYTGGNRRVGIGAEAWTDNFKMSANSYLGTTDWHSSRDMHDYDEKPADGFDIRAEGYLPAYPQLGASIMYEKYYGDQVALFDKDDLQKNPSAVTVGLSYTPIPLITAGIDYKRGQDSMDETHFSLNLRYEIGQSWQSQISPDGVALRRSLAGSRYDLVERNNEIILQYKKKAQAENALADMTLITTQNNSPADGNTANQIQVHAVTTDGKPAKNTAVSWTVSGSGKLSASSSVTNDEGDATVSVTNTTAEQVIVTATSGSLVRTTTSEFDAAAAALNLQLTKNNSRADGSDQNTGLVTLKDSKGNVMTDAAISWTVDNGAKIVQGDSTTDSKGQAHVSYTNTIEGQVKLSASNGDKTESVNSTFGGQQTQVTVAASTITDNQSADGNAVNTVQALVTDADGKPLKDESVSWSLSGSAVATTPTTVTTDSNGKGTLSLKDSVAEAVIATASVQGQSGQTTAHFVATAAVVDKVVVAMNTNYQPANGTDANVAQATVTDVSGKPMKGVSVEWKVTGSAVATSTATATTDDAGHATFNFTDTVMENVVVTAKASEKSGEMTAKFTTSNRKVSTVALVAKGSGSQTDPVVYTATTRNTDGEVVPDAGIIWSGGIISNTSIACNTGDSVTNPNGKATKTCYNKTASIVSDVTTNVLVTIGSVVNPNKDVTDGTTQDYVATN